MFQIHPIVSSYSLGQLDFAHFISGQTWNLKKKKIPSETSKNIREPLLYGILFLTVTHFSAWN